MISELRDLAMATMGRDAFLNVCAQNDDLSLTPLGGQFSKDFEQECLPNKNTFLLITIRARNQGTHLK